MIDPEQLQKERAERLREALEVSPHQLCGLATKPGDSDEDLTRARERWEIVVQNKVISLIEDADNGEQGLGRFWEELMVCPMPFFCLDSTSGSFLQELDIPALEILVQVFEQRKDECFAHLTKLSSTVFDTSSQSFEDFFEQRCCAYCNRMGEKYEEVKNYRGSIPWYEKSLAHGIKLAPSARSKIMLSTQHCNLGLAQKKAGLLSAALGNYNASLQLEPGGNALENRKTLLREMKEWTGSSDKLTPGC